MTIGGWILLICIIIIISVACIGIGAIFYEYNRRKSINTIVAIAIITLSFLSYKGLSWYYQSTASGQRALTDQQSELKNGLERIITVYTADGDVIARYEGRIDIEGNDGGYVIFDFEGRRYTYYNCFVESIAIIE